MKSVAALALLFGSSTAFVQNGLPMRAPVAKARSATNSLTMKAGPGIVGMVGSDIEQPNFDPLGFTKTTNANTLAWYRQAELKHGRIAMLAALGQIVQSWGVHFSDASGVFDERTPWAAMIKVYNERPIAVAQIVLAIFAIEVYGQANQDKSGVPGDLLWDPLGLKPSDPETWEKTQLRELKNGRLAMLAIAGMIAQESYTHLGVIEAIQQGKLNPFGDGIGYF